MPQVITLGEALIDFVSLESGVDVKDAPGFLKAPGGAPANVAVGLAKLGVEVGFVGKVGDDPFGHFLEETLRESGVDTSRLLFEPGVRTALAFVSLTAEGERSFSFYRNPSADMMLRSDEIDEGYISSARVFHFGSITLISEPSRSATLRAVEISGRHGLTISYDPNLRINLWPSPGAAKEEILRSIPMCHILKVNEEEVEFLTGERDIERGSRKLREMGPTVVVVTLGKDGCLYNDGRNLLRAAAPRVKAVDTTGAGDGFVAGLLKGILDIRTEGRDIRDIPRERIKDILRFANIVGAITTTRKGAIPALPTADEVKAWADLSQA